MATQIVNKSLDELIPYENNPRNNENAVDAVMNSIREFGFKVPIVVDKENVIVAGHTRWEAAKRLGLESVPCIIADDLTDEQVRAFRLADNKTSELAGWDFRLLEEELDRLELDMSQFGFKIADDIDIDSFFSDTEPTNEDESVKDEPKKIQCPHCGEWFDA